MTTKPAISATNLKDHIAYTTLSATIPLRCPKCGLTFGVLYSNSERCPEAHCLMCFEDVCGLTGKERQS